MSVVVIDNFDGPHSHGQMVLDSLREYYSGQVYTLNTHSDKIPRQEVYNLLQEALDKIRSGEYQNVSALNMSYGGGETSSPKYWVHFPEWYELWKELYELGIEVFFPSGNESSQYPNWNGVSVLSSSPFVHAVSAIHGDYDKIKDNLDRHIPSYAEYCYAITDELASGYSPDLHIGTSFSSPKLCGVYATLMEEKHLDSMEIDTMYEITAKPIEAHNGEFLWVLDSEKLLNVNEPVNVNDPEVLAWDLYELVCGRHPDPGGLEFWTAIFESTQNLNPAIESFIETAKANHDVGNNNVTIKDKIQAFYHFFFGREPDREGLEYWIDRTMDARDWQDVFKEIWDAGLGHENIQHSEFVDDILNINDHVCLMGVQETIDTVDYFTNNV